MPSTTESPTMSPADIAAHEAASYVSWRSREKFLRDVNANGQIVTAGEAMLADRISHLVDIEVTVDCVSPVSPDGDVFLVLSSLDGTGKALAVTDASERADALGWMERDIVRLFARATRLYGQPAIDLRRATAIHGSVTANTAPLPEASAGVMHALERAFAGRLDLVGGAS